MNLSPINSAFRFMIDAPGQLPDARTLAVFRERHHRWRRSLAPRRWESQRLPALPGGDHLVRVPRIKIDAHSCRHRPIPFRLPPARSCSARSQPPTRDDFRNTSAAAARLLIDRGLPPCSACISNPEQGCATQGAENPAVGAQHHREIQWFDPVEQPKDPPYQRPPPERPTRHRVSAAPP